jgi:hypothetical protein
MMSLGGRTYATAPFISGVGFILTALYLALQSIA